jgi:hypothetical protein
LDVKPTKKMTASLGAILRRHAKQLATAEAAHKLALAPFAEAAATYEAESRAATLKVNAATEPFDREVQETGAKLQALQNARQDTTEARRIFQAAMDKRRELSAPAWEQNKNERAAIEAAFAPHKEQYESAQRTRQQAIQLADSLRDIAIERISAILMVELDYKEKLAQLTSQ